MRAALMVESHADADFAQLQRLALTAEAHGFDGFFHADHLLAVTTADQGPGTDAWANLAALAAVTSTIALGPRVSPVGWRPPGTLAVLASTVDRISGGRVEVGMGTGWSKREHVAYGVPFPDLRERFARLEEALEIMRGLWTHDRFSYAGAYYRIDDAPGCPTARTPHPPFVIGGGGTVRTPALAARFAAEFNAFNGSSEDAAAAYARVRAACEAIGRDPAELVYSQNMVFAIGEDEADANRRAELLHRRLGDPLPLDEFVAAHRHEWLFGTPGDARAELERRAAAGVQRVIMQDELVDEPEHVELLGRDVLAALR